MSQLDELLARSAAEVRRAVSAMPEGEVTAVAQASTRKTVLTTSAALVAAVVVALVGWSLLNSGGTDVIDQPVVPADPNAVMWPTEFRGAGAYLSNDLSVPFSFSLEDVEGVFPWQDPATSPSRTPWEVGLLGEGSQGWGDRGLVFMVAERLSDPETLRGTTWPVDDIDGWLEAAGEAVVEGPTEVNVAGRMALRFSLMSLAPCESVFTDTALLPCDTLAYSALSTDGQLFLNSTVSTYDVWWVPDVGAGAFVVFASSFDRSRDDWLPIVEDVVASLGIGE